MAYKWGVTNNLLTGIILQVGDDGYPPKFNKSLTASVIQRNQLGFHKPRSQGMIFLGEVRFGGDRLTSY